MRNMSEVLAKFRIKDKPGLFGIEIETEVQKESHYPAGFLEKTLDGNSPVGYEYVTTQMREWKGVYDGSLRNFGVEYVFKEPLSYEAAMAALDDFGDKTSNVKFIQDAPGTSVHVHMNVLNDTPVVFATMICILTLFEGLLLEYSGPTRRSNLFALGHRNAEETRYNIHRVLSAIEDGEVNALMLREQDVKYAFMNLATLTKYGSLEIRSFRGTTDVRAIKEWVDILHRVYQYAKTPFLNPRNFYKAYQQREFELVDDVFGPYAEKLKCEGWRELIQRNEFFFAKYATAVKEWSTFGMKFPEIKGAEKKKSLNTQSIDAILQHAQSMAINAPVFWNELSQPPQPTAAYVITDDHDSEF